MAKKYTGSLTLEWFNKNRSIITQKAEEKRESDVPAPRINWINKDEALFYEISEEGGKGLTPYWVDRNDIRVKESRPLVFQKAYKAVPEGDGFKVEESDVDDPEIENILIKGDNLLALNTLKKMFDQKPDEEKVKCIYIDPPYETGSAFENYDDNLGNSEWLTMMRDRLVILKDLLKNDGSIFIQIDDNQLAHLKVLCDEVFGRQNFIKILSVKMSTASGVKTSHKERTILKEKESIIVYAKNKDFFSIVPQYVPKREWDSEFQYVLLKKDSFNPQDWEIKGLKQWCIENNIPYDFDDSVFLNFAITNANIIWRRAFIRGKWKEESQNNEGKIIINIDDSGMEHLYYKGREMYFLKNSFHDCHTETGIVNTMSSLLCDFWTDINTGKLFNEGDVDFRNGKKPEFLISRIFNMQTSEGDIVLDIFGGSGSTFSVAHKMNRKWIGVEIGEHADTHIIKRIKNVLRNSDHGGVTQLTNWEGGGSFKYYHLGKSIISIDKDGYGDFNWSLGRDFIEKSLLATYDFILDENFTCPPSTIENPPKVGFYNVNNYTMAGVVSLSSPEENYGALDNDYISELIASIRKQKSPQSITIFTNRGVELAWESKPEDVEIIKVPHAIFAELER